MREHREIDERFGQFLAAAFSGDAAAAAQRDRGGGCDDALRPADTDLEEERVYPNAPAHDLAAPAQETAGQRLHRELLLEHVQVRELSAMIRHLLDEKNDLNGARRLAPNLARRWDAHTAREERDLPVAER